MPLLAELVAFQTTRCYKDLAPTEPGSVAVEFTPERNYVFQQPARALALGQATRIGALKAIPTPRCGVQFRQRNPRTASGVAPERGDKGLSAPTDS